MSEEKTSSAAALVVGGLLAGLALGAGGMWFGKTAKLAEEVGDLRGQVSQKDVAIEAQKYAIDDWRQVAAKGMPIDVSYEADGATWKAIVGIKTPDDMVRRFGGTATGGGSEAEQKLSALEAALAKVGR